MHSPYRILSAPHGDLYLHLCTHRDPLTIYRSKNVLIAAL